MEVDAIRGSLLHSHMMKMVRAERDMQLILDNLPLGSPTQSADPDQRERTAVRSVATFDTCYLDPFSVISHFSVPQIRHAEAMGCSILLSKSAGSTKKHSSCRLFHGSSGMRRQGLPTEMKGLSLHILRPFRSTSVLPWLKQPQPSACPPAVLLFPKYGR